MATLIQLLEEELSRRDNTVSNITQRIFLKEVLQSYILLYLQPQELSTPQSLWWNLFAHNLWNQQNVGRPRP